MLPSQSGTTQPNTPQTEASPSLVLPFPQFPFECSPSPPPTPTPQSQQITPLNLFSNQGTGNTPPNAGNNPPNAMLVDNLVTSIVEPPAPNNGNDAPNTEVTPLQAILDEIPTQLLPTPNGDQATDHLDRFTRAEMPDVHEAHPTAAFELIDREVIGIWERYPGNKLIATPFGSESRDQTKHKIIRSKIFAAAADITQSQEIAVAPPTPNDKAKRDQRTPATFLIYKMTDAQYEALLQRKVWSATEITFKVAPLMPSRPSFLFSITGLTTLSVSDVFSMVKSVWEDETSVAYYQSILSSKSLDKKDTTQRALEVFVSSLWVERLDIRIRQAGRSVLTPKFNIFAISKDIHDHNTWSNL